MAQALVPLKDLVAAKSRLSGVLSPAERRSLAQAMVEDVLALSSAPVILSHGGLKGVCDTERNLSDALMKRFASNGGLIGIGYWDAAVCDASPEGIVRSIRYAIDLLGVDHVALGSDYDGAVHAPFDTSELSVLTEVMLQSGFSEEEMRKVLGENAKHFLLENLPGNIL